VFNRSLTEQGSKAVYVKRKDMNKVTHSYTAQYVITLSGELLPTVLICLQESTGVFGPRVQKTINDFCRMYTNNIFQIGEIIAQFVQEIFKRMYETLCSATTFSTSD